MDKQNRELPKGWKRARLGEIARIVGGSTPDTGIQEYWDGEIVWITPADLGQMGDRWIRASKRTISRKGYESCGTELLSAGSIVLSSRAPIGYLGIAASPLCTNQGCKSFIPTSEVDSDYLYWRILYAVPELKELGSGATFAEISKSALEAFEITFPSLPEQMRIAAILNERMAAIDKTRTAAKAQLAAALALRSAYLTKLFPNKEMVRSGWRWSELGQICTGKGQYGLSIKTSTNSRGTAIIGMKQIRDGELFWDDVRFVDLAKDDFEKYGLKKGDILINRTNSAELVGKTAVFSSEREAVFASYLIRYRVKDEIADSRYLSLYINSRSGRAYIEKNMTRAIGQVNINARALSKMPIPFPGKGEQVKLMTYLDSLGEQISHLRDKINGEICEINALSQALLRQAFNGEL